MQLQTRILPFAINRMPPTHGLMGGLYYFHSLGCAWRKIITGLAIQLKGFDLQ